MCGWIEIALSRGADVVLVSTPNAMNVWGRDKRYPELAELLPHHVRPTRRRLHAYPHMHHIPRASSPSQQLSAVRVVEGFAVRVVSGWCTSHTPSIERGAVCGQERVCRNHSTCSYLISVGP